MAATPGSREVCVYVFQRRDAGELVLMLRRPASRGGFWRGVHGRPSAGESDRQAAARSTWEETRLDVRSGFFAVEHPYGYSLDTVPAAPRPPHGEPGSARVEVATFAAEAPAGWRPTLDAGRHDAYEWCTFAEARKRLDWPVERDALIDRLLALGLLEAELAGTRSTLPGG